MRWCVRAFTGESDEAVVLRAQAGEAGAAEELLNRYKNAVRARAGAHEPLGELLLVFRYGVDVDFHISLP